MRISNNVNSSHEWRTLPEQYQNVIKSNQTKLPVKVGDIAKGLGLIVKQATLKAGISGEIREESGNFVIRVNRHDVKHRQRFTVAHEIAHFLLHRDKIGDGIVDDILYRSSLSDILEAQANRLAADIIMPRELLENYLLNTKEAHPEQKIEKLAEIAEVSTTALKIRLGLK